MKRTIAAIAFATELLEQLVNQNPLQATTLIICSTRRAFLHQIAPSILKPQPQEIPASQESLDEDEPHEAAVGHPFTLSTLRMIAATTSIKLVFCASIYSLRAYLSKNTLSTQNSSPGGMEHASSAITSNGSLVIVDLIFLHHATSEFSVQGLSRTLACAVEAAARNQMHLRLVECMDIHEVESPNRGPRLWEAQVPLLSGSVKLGGDGAIWAGRAISVGRIASRWFDFEKRNNEVTGQMDDEEMLV